MIYCAKKALGKIKTVSIRKGLHYRGILSAHYTLYSNSFSNKIDIDTTGSGVL